MMRHEVFTGPAVRSASRGRPLRFLLEALAVLVVALLLVLVPSAAGPGAGDAARSAARDGSGTALDRLAAREIESRRARP